MAHMEASLFLFVQDRFAWNLMTASFGFAYIGVIMVLTQGVLIRKLLPLFGEARLLLIGQICSAIGFIGIAITPSVSLLAIAVTFLGLGNGLATPSLSGSVSLLTKSDEQGRMLGINQGLAALGRIIGPVTGGYLYQMLGTGAPFLVAAGLISCGFLVSASVVKGIPNGHIQPST
jgi:MFS family permease